MNNKSKFLILSAITAFLSLINHIYLASLHYQLKLSLMDGKSLCNVSKTFNCDTVAASAYSSLLNIPMAALGASTHFVLLILLAIVALNITPNVTYYRVHAFLLAVFTAAVSVVMGFLSAQLGSLCLFCIGAYLLSFLNVWFLWKAQDFEASIPEAIKAAFTRAHVALIIPIAIPAFGWLGDKMVLDGYGLKKFDLIVQESVSYWQISKTESFDLQSGLALNNTDRPAAIIIEFADFLCPHCKRISPTLASFTKARPDVKFIFKSFPLDGNCNDAITTKGDGMRCHLAAAVFCTEKMNKKGWAMKEFIFSQQESFYSPVSVDELSERLATEVGLPKDELKSCMVSPEMNAYLKALAKEGENAKISGTPSVFMNGRLLQRAQLMPVLEGAYNRIKGL